MYTVVPGEEEFVTVRLFDKEIPWPVVGSTNEHEVHKNKERYWLP